MEPLDFEYYIRAGEPEQRERAQNWATAIGLQAVDGLPTSKYLHEVARRNIEGEITIDEAQELVRSYYVSQAKRDEEENNTEEGDRASANIAKLLVSPTFSFTVAGLKAIHSHIFRGVFKHAGRFRDYDITKKEWVLNGDTVMYVNSLDLERTVEYELQREKQFVYTGRSIDEVISHFCEFISGLWQIHPFAEGNTRTTAVFAIKYLRSMGFEVDNDPFRQHSWYFRNALVRANYRNVRKGIQPHPTLLVRFFRNILLGEKNELKNRYCHVKWEEGAVTQDMYRTSTGQVQDKLTPQIKAVILALGDQQLSRKDLMASLSLKGRDNFLNLYLKPTMAQGIAKELYPDSPRHPRQRYLLTVRGLTIYNDLKHG